MHTLSGHSRSTLGTATRYRAGPALALLLTIVSTCGMVRSAYAATPAPGAADTKKVETFLRSTMEKLKLPGMQVAVAHHGKIVFKGAYGAAEVEFGTPVTNQTVFPIHSITKAFVGVAVMQLVEAGKLDLAAPISTYLDDLPQAWRTVTVRQLMTHTSGLPELRLYPSDDSRLIDADEGVAWAKIRAAPLSAEPGAEFKYNTTNYILIGKIIDKLSGQPFTQYIADREFKPIGMASASFGDSNDFIPHLAGTYWYYQYVNYARISTDTLNVYLREWLPFMRTAAGINTTAEDLANWATAVQNGTLLKKESLSSLWSPAMLNNGKPGGFNDWFSGYALGWPVLLNAKHRTLAPIGGGRAAMFIYPDEELTVVVLTNLMGSGPESIVDDLAALFVPTLADKK